jgi:NAD(P)-dependent dehydrogenase (short-subunit alcohol dehydrogenase family)
MDLHLRGKTAVVTGGGGAICGAIARGLASEGAHVAVWDIATPAAEVRAEEIRAAGGHALAVRCDATDRASVVDALAATVERFSTVDILVNGAGGSRKQTTTAPDLAFFDISSEEMRRTMDLNYTSAVVPCQEVGRIFARRKEGVVLTISSIVGQRPITRSLSYCSGKAALDNFTRWLAVHMATTYGPAIRVNAIAPGFMLTDQNRFLLVDEATGAQTERTRQILGAVPMGRLGEPADIVGAALWLVSDRARFVTGVVVPVDGGFTAFPGV